MSGRRASFIRGKRMRATRLTAAGDPVFGANSVVTTSGFITVGMSSEIEEGESVSQENANGDTCVSEPATPSLTGFTGEIEFCEVDFGLFEMLTGQPVVLNDDGDAIGITESTNVDLSRIAFALELWLGADDKGARARTGSQGKWGYVLLPLVSGGVVGDVTVENGAINFTISNIATRNGSRWGAGPHQVELVGGQPSALRVPMRNRDHRRTMLVEVEPPRVYSGATPLLNPTDSGLSTLDVTTSGLEAEFSTTGTGGLFVDFGDGEWDYSANSGSVSHTYEVAGTYNVVARRGTSTVEQQVTVPSGE